MSVGTIPFAGSILNAPACQLGEGPSYDPRSETAWWFDILGKRLFEWRLGTDAVLSHDLPVMGSVVAWVDAGRQVLATETGLQLRDLKTGALTPLTPLEADNAATRSNDGRVHPCGAMWIGTMGKQAEPGAGAIYHVARGTVTRLYSDITIPNAICFSPDGATAYFTDTTSAKLMRVEIDPATALPLSEPAVFYDHSGGNGGLDGAVCDADGVIWNARWGAGCIDAYSPGGQRLKSLAVPASQGSCPAFIGSNADRLLVTSAREGLSPAALAADPEAGKTFVLDQPVKGRFEPDYIL